MLGQRLGGLAGDDGARGAAIQDKAGDESAAGRCAPRRSASASRPMPSRRTAKAGRGPARVGGEQRRAHQTGDARWPVDDDVIGVAGQLGRFAMQRVARQADDAEQPRQPFPCPLLRPVERRALRIGVDQGDSFPFPGPFAGEMQGERRLADAALLVEERDDHRALLLGFPPIAAVAQQSEGLDSCRLDSKLGGSEPIDRA